jgi:tetratricopeptide (TPR) repeat protein
MVQAGVAIALAIVLSLVTIKTTAYWADDLALFTRAVAIAPDSAIAAEYLAGALSRLQRCGEALPLLKRALAVDMANPDPYIKLADCEKNLGDWAGAEDYLRQSIFLFPRLPSGYARLSVVDLHRNNLADAEAHIRRAMQLGVPGAVLNSGYHTQLGLILEREGAQAEALREYQAELSANPGSEEAQDLARSLQQRIGVAPTTGRQVSK